MEDDQGRDAFRRVGGDRRGAPPRGCWQSCRAGRRRSGSRLIPKRSVSSGGISVPKPGAKFGSAPASAIRILVLRDLDLKRWRRLPDRSSEAYAARLRRAEDRCYHPALRERVGTYVLRYANASMVAERSRRRRAARRRNGIRDPHPSAEAQYRGLRCRIVRAGARRSKIRPTIYRR